MDVDEPLDPFERQRAVMRRDAVHGTWDGWKKGCRCKHCNAAARKYARNEQIKARRAEGLPRGDPRHGTSNAYRTYGCHCDKCIAAERARVKRSNEQRRERERER